MVVIVSVLDDLAGAVDDRIGGTTAETEMVVAIAARAVFEAFLVLTVAGGDVWCWLE